MIIINNSMAKSGSTLLHYYTFRLTELMFPTNGQCALVEATSSKKLNGTGSFVHTIDKAALDILIEISETHGPVVVKSHCNTSPLLLRALSEQRILMTFIHRDPRDVILSAIDHCIRDQNAPQAQFQKYTSVATSIYRAKWWSQMACDWISTGQVFVSRYRDIVVDPARELSALSSYLGLNATPQMIDRVIEEERATRAYGKNQFNEGKLERYQSEMTSEEKSLCESELGDLISKLGY